MCTASTFSLCRSNWVYAIIIWYHTGIVDKGISIGQDQQVRLYFVQEMNIQIQDMQHVVPALRVVIFCKKVSYIYMYIILAEECLPC